MFDLKGRGKYYPTSTPFTSRRVNMFTKQRTGIIENIRSGNLFMAASFVGSAAACYVAWAGNPLLAVGLTAVALIVFMAGAAVSFANERLEAISAEYRERETSREIWASISKIEDKLEEIESKKGR